ncbi:hotdog fold thioesterase [Numidum massiliense]|uniref:hotdog fold thioesterase n=1 Tax=Numidum massiliense TaxID=1522315 RepID=UPI0006D53ACF|nr:hotdog fold thioesterase [Numidum massiliense]
MKSKIEQLNETGTIVDALGIQMVEASPDKMVMTMPVNGNTRQPFGLLHGGASVVLAETIASYGAWLNVDQKKEAVVGLEINANHVRSKQDGMVTGIGVPLFRGRKTMVWEIKIVDEAEKLICISRCTVAVIPQ